MLSPLLLQTWFPAVGPELVQNQVTLPGFEQPVVWLTRAVATDELGAVSREPGGVVTGCAPPARVERRSPVRDAKQGEGAVVGGVQGFQRKGRRGKKDSGLDTGFREVLPERFDLGPPDERVLLPAADERPALPVGSAHYAFQSKELAWFGVTLAPAAARAQELRIKDAKTTPSICPFCSVGCATLIHTVDGKIVNIEGDPRSPHNEGTLCPKGAAIYQLHMNPNRATKVLHRKPGARDWDVVELEWAMDRVAELTKKTRDETFIEKLPNGKLVNMTPAIFALGGATLDNEFNHVCQKFWRGLGVVAIENQARI